MTESPILLEVGSLLLTETGGTVYVEPTIPTPVPPPVVVVPLPTPIVLYTYIGGPLFVPLGQPIPFVINFSGLLLPGEGIVSIASESDYLILAPTSEPPPSVVSAVVIFTPGEIVSCLAVTNYGRAFRQIVAFRRPAFSYN